MYALTTSFLPTAGGKDSKVVVTGSVNLDPEDQAGSSQIAQDLRIQDSARSIEFDNMYHLTKVNSLRFKMLQYVSVNCCFNNAHSLVTRDAISPA